MQIYHNARCSKSRQALALLEANGKSPEIIEYMKEGLTRNELEAVITRLGIDAVQLIRKGEIVYKEKFKAKDPNKVDWIQAMIDYPNLMERPIVIQGNKAVIGRPPELVLDI